MINVTTSRQFTFQDSDRISQAKSRPEYGPQCLFFSGGSALNGIARCLKQYSHNSVHLITPFDSGGSSQVLRQAFDMPAVGDLRSRVMALANESIAGLHNIYDLFSYRLPKAHPDPLLQQEFAQLLSGEHPLLKGIEPQKQQSILKLLQIFSDVCPDGFNLAGASIGNLILTGCYFAKGRILEPALQHVAQLVDVKGSVHAVTNQTLDLGVKLLTGKEIIGQRQMTGKEVPPISAPIAELFLASKGHRVDAETVPLLPHNQTHIFNADLICYAPGSLYSSLLASLMPFGTGTAISRTAVPKVYLPSLGIDPECPGMSLADKVDALLCGLKADFSQPPEVSDLLSAVLCDPSQFNARERAQVEDKCSVPCLSVSLVKHDSSEAYDPELVSEALISLAGKQAPSLA